MLMAIATPAAAQDAAAANGRELVTIAPGGSAQVMGLTYSSAEGATAIVVLSSELQTAAVVSGTLEIDNSRARAGSALLTPIDGGKTRVFGFDAARLAATLPPAWSQAAAEPLHLLAAGQRRRKFWGLIEPVGVNAVAPAAPQAEAIRSTYLGNATILALRREARGDRGKLAGLTARRFAEAVAAGDARAIADLIDPKPFTDASNDPAVWQPARDAFARRLAGDKALKSAMAAPLAASAGATDSFDAGGAFRIALVVRDRAMFVAAVEPQS